MQVQDGIVIGYSPDIHPINLGLTPALSKPRVYDLSPNSNLPNQVRLMQVGQPLKFANRSSSPTVQVRLMQVHQSDNLPTRLG